MVENYPASIILFAKYVRKELSQQEQEKFQNNCIFTINECRIARDVNVLENIFPGKIGFESLVRNRSEAFITNLKRLGSMGYKFDWIMEYLSKFESDAKT